MKPLSAFAFVILAMACLVQGSSRFGSQADPGGLKETLIRLDEQSWEAWQKRDGAFFQDFLSDDHVEIGTGGVTNKATVVAGVASPACVVRSYVTDNYNLTAFDDKTAMLTYRATQDTHCGGVAVPSPAWVSSLFVKRGNRWLNAAYQQSPIGEKESR